MKIIDREIQKVLSEDLKTFPVLTLTGPRQSGKSTVLKKMLPDWKYVNLEEPSALEFAQQDPKGFLNNYVDRVIIDEIQRAPSILSQMQVEIDKDRRPGRFAITGSHNLLLLEKVSQTLAGRTSIRHLLPFSYRELNDNKIAPDTLDASIFLGGYPLIHANVTNAQFANTWLDSYMQTYVERDVRMIRNVSDLPTFRRFLRLCAGRVGQLLDLSGLGGDTGISHNTARDWVSVLEAGFIAFRLEPYFKNFSKRIIKSPKLYFYDTGLLCRILEIRTKEELALHPFRGNIFENYCIVETLKASYNRGERPAVFFWRDQSIEVDMLLQLSSTKLAAIECKAGATAVTEFLNGPLKFKEIANKLDVVPKVVFGGTPTQKRTEGTFQSWSEFVTDPLEDYS